MGEGRRLGRVASVEAYLAAIDPFHQLAQPVDVHRLVEAVVHRLAHQRVVRQIDRAGHVLLAGDLLGKDGRQQIVGAHPLERRRRSLAVALAQDGQRAGSIPAPARGEHRHRQQRLRQRLLDVRRADEGEEVFQRRAVLRAHREEDGIVAGRRLQLEVERAAEVLAQRQPPGAVHAAPERRVHHELHAAALVEEALEDHVAVRRHQAERVKLGPHVANELRRRLRRQARLSVQPGGHVAATLKLLRDLAPERGDLLRQLGRARRGLAQPERDRGRRAVGVLHPHDARLDAADAPRCRAQQEDVARHALDRKVLVQRADERALRLRQHSVVGHVGDRAAALERRHARASPSAQHAVDAIAMEVGVRAPASGGDAFAEHLDDLVEVAAAQRRVGRGLSHQGVQVVLAPGLAGALGDDLLREDVERRHRRVDTVQPAGADGANQRGALDQLIAGRGKEAALGREPQRVAGAANALEEGGDAARRLQLADEVHRADIDAQFQRGRGDQRLHLARLQPLL